MTDSKGEQIHQTLMPKKMQRLDESWDFRPFKFRIQAFTNAFTDRIQLEGIHEDLMSGKKIKLYLWNQPYISRFNEDGKKAKSKGNHIWNVDARKLPGGGWEFRQFQRKISANFPATAYIGVGWSWQPRVWDPHTSSASIEATFASPAGSLPAWLSWNPDGSMLAGTPPADALPCSLEVVASYAQDGAQKQLREVLSLNVGSVGADSPLSPASALPPPQPQQQSQQQQAQPMVTSTSATANTTPVAPIYSLPPAQQQQPQQQQVAATPPSNGQLNGGPLLTAQQQQQQQQLGMGPPPGMAYYPVPMSQSFVGGQMMGYGDGCASIASSGPWQIGIDDLLPPFVDSLMQAGMMPTYFNAPSGASAPLLVNQALGPPYTQQQAPPQQQLQQSPLQQQSQQQQQQQQQQDQRLTAAEVAVVQAVEEKHYGQGHSYSHADPMLVAESDALSSTVLAQAHAQRQEQFGQTGFVSTEFAQSTLDDATNRARDAVHRSAEILPASATSVDLIRASSSFLPAPMAQSQVQLHMTGQQQQQQQTNILPPGSGASSQFNSPYI